MPKQAVNIIVRNALGADLDQIMEVEQSWPQAARAPREKFVARLEKFAAGFFVAEQDGCIRGTMTSCPTVYAADRLDRFQSWDQATNRGFLHEVQAMNGYNAICLVSGVVQRGWRGGDLFQRLVLAEVDLARQLGWRFVVAGAVIPRYAWYCEKYGEIPAEQYVFLKRGRRFVDPFMELYHQLGFRVPDSDHVLEDYFPDDASRNYAALVVREVFPQEGDTQCPPN